MGAAAPPSTFTIASNDTKDFWIKPPDGPLVVGKYAGSVWISSDQSKVGTLLPITFYRSSWCRSALGLALLVGSVFAAWFFGVYLRSRANRLQLERPFTILREQQKAIVAQYGGLTAGIRGETIPYQKALATLGENLATTALSGILGTGVPPAYGSPPQVSNGEKLDELSNKTALLKKLMEEGLLVVNRTADHPKALEAARAIGLLSGASAVNENTAKQLAEAIALLHTHADAAAKFAFTARTETQFREPTIQSIDLSLQSINRFAWLFLAAGSVAIGWYVLILTRPGFGTLPDYLFCVAWGFGLPAGATGLASTTTSTIATAFKIAT